MNQLAPDLQQMYQQFAQTANTGNYSQLDTQQAAALLQHFLQTAPPDVQQRAFQEAFNQMPQEHRQLFGQQLGGTTNPQQMAQSLQQTGQQQPNALQQILGPGGLLSNPMAKVAVAGLAAVAAKHFLSSRGH